MKAPIFFSIRVRADHFDSSRHLLGSAVAGSAQTHAALRHPGVSCRDDQYGARLLLARPLPNRLARIVRYRRGVERPPHEANDNGAALDIRRCLPDLLLAGGIAVRA